ncbi:LlaJI family restriction endonuclease [Eubacterium sp. TM05-53]|nr:LlaJI family restriction endonuclease [Eubacterium sp. TM05-53]
MNCLIRMSKMNKEPKINPVTKSNDFVGIRIEDGEINIYVPQVFRKETNYKRDLLLFLKSISLAKTLEKEKLDKGSNNLDNVWPINSYLWIIKDYLENGFYYNREKVYSNSYSGKIEWKKTMKQIPIYSDGNIIYDKLVTSKMAASNDLIAQIYKLCLKQSIEKIGWVYNYNLKVDVQQIVSTSEMVATVRKEINNTFDDIKRMRFNHMLKILKTTEGNKVVSNEYTYGIENYYYVFETMVDKLFDGIKESEKKKYNPNGYWQLNNQKPGLASSLRPDTILKKDGATYILDAKMYQYGVTKDVRDLPETQSIQKQITYGDYAYHQLNENKVRNAFILPYNKKLKCFVEDTNTLKYNDGNLAYFGQAYTDWRNTEDQKDYEKVYAFGIDFNYLLKNYNKPDYVIIDSLCSKIEELIHDKKV